MFDIDQETLLRFIKGQATDDEARDVMFALSHSRTVKRRYEALKSITQDFDSAWSDFAGDLSGVSLELVREFKPLAVIRAFWQKAKKNTTIGGTLDLGAESISGLLQPPALGYGCALEDAERLEESSKSLAKGNEDAALEQLAGVEAGVAPQSTYVVEHGGQVALFAELSASRETLSIRIAKDVVSGELFIELDEEMEDGSVHSRLGDVVDSGLQWAIEFRDIRGTKLDLKAYVDESPESEGE